MHNLHNFVTSYAIILVANFTTVFCCMAVIYLKAFCRIKRMTQSKQSVYLSHKVYRCIILSSETNNENTPLYGANQAIILAGHKEAKKRVLVFFSVYFISGAMSE